MLCALASAAFQTRVGLRPSALNERDKDGRPVKIDSRHAYGATRNLVKRFWSDHRTAT
jgi:hypothetical protein